MRRVATALILVVLAASVVPPAMGHSSAKAYDETHVSFEASQNAITNYAVHNETMLSSVSVQSQNSVEDSALVDASASLSAVTQVQGAGLNVGATSNTEARVRAENGATMTAHDNGHGILVVESGNQSDYVVAELSEGANASAESGSQVSVTTQNGTEGTFIVVGDGNVTVNENGDVSARLGEDGRLVFRSYPDQKDDGDDKEEQLIADGKAKAEAYVMSEGEETVTDTVTYGQNTTVEAKETADGEVSFAVNRTTHEGTVLITSVSREVVDASENLTVKVDGEAAVEAAAHSQLESAVGSDKSRYMVQSAGSASASTDVLVAVNHFSERTVSLASGPSDGASDGETTSNETSGDETTDDGMNGDDGASDDETEGDGASDETTDGGGDGNSSGGVPGFGATVAVAALIGAALLARLR